MLLRLPEMFVYLLMFRVEISYDKYQRLIKCKFSELVSAEIPSRVGGQFRVSEVKKPRQ